MLFMLQNPDLPDILAAFAAAGEEARVVGGAVRDSLLRLPIVDIDIATTALPDASARILSAAGFDIKPIGLEHGVILAVRDGRSYEIATLREDVQTDGRHAVVRFTRDWRVDAMRRDFTINALSMDAAGTVYDYTGGEEDLRGRRVRFIGDAAQRVAEDYLRILRFYRFSARFADALDTDGRAACKAARAHLSLVAAERVTDEIRKLLSTRNPMLGAAAMTADGMVPVLMDSDALETLILREKQYGIQPWTLRLAAWAGMAQGFDEALFHALMLSRAQQNEIYEFATADVSRLHHAVHYYGKDRVRGAMLLRTDDNDLPERIQQLDAISPQKFPLSGNDLMAMGIPPGAPMGKILQETEDWWLDGACTADKQGCMDFARKLIS